MHENEISYKIKETKTDFRAGLQMESAHRKTYRFGSTFAIM